MSAVLDCKERQLRDNSLMRMIILSIMAASLLTGCGLSPNAPGVGGVTKGQAEELNQAAAELDSRANVARAAAEAR